MKRGLATAEIDSVKPIKKMVGQYADWSLKPQTQGSTIPVWSLILAVILSFFIGVMATIVLQAELGLRKL